jgi:hypothetical protein
MEDSRCDDSKSARGLTASAVMKFNNFFKQNLVKLLIEEARRDQFSDEANDAPKYSVCFTDLAEFLNLKDEVMLKVAQHDFEDDSIASFRASNTNKSNYYNNMKDQPI